MMDTYQNHALENMKQKRACLKVGNPTWDPTGTPIYDQFTPHLSSGIAGSASICWQVWRPVENTAGSEGRDGGFFLVKDRIR